MFCSVGMFSLFCACCFVFSRFLLFNCACLVSIVLYCIVLYCIVLYLSGVVLCFVQ